MNQFLPSQQLRATGAATLPEPEHSETHEPNASQESEDQSLQVNAFFQVSVCIVPLLVTFATLCDDMGWRLGVGFLFVFVAHELGHMGVATYHGVPVIWPIFIPYVGVSSLPWAILRISKKRPMSP
jgi:hypothetical protein